MTTALSVFIAALVIMRIAQGIVTKPAHEAITYVLAGVLVLWMLACLALYLAILTA